VEFPVVLTAMLSEKVESLLNVRYLGFLFREFQASFAQKIGDEGFDFRFQYLFGDACNNEVITVPHQIDLLVHAFKGFRARMGVLLTKYPFQSVQRHIGKDRTDDTTLWRTIFCRVEDGFVHVSCLQPFVQDGFIHRNMAQQPWVADFVKGFANSIPLSTTHSMTIWRS
jgi:hypothetical protein